MIDVETNQTVMGVTTHYKGKIDKISAPLKETYPVGTVLGYVEASEEDAAKFKKTAPDLPQQELAEEIPGREEESAKPMTARDGAQMKSRDGGWPVPVAARGASLRPPRLRA